MHASSLARRAAARHAGCSYMLAVGETLQGRYRIVREIGAGGMGTVYEGENLLIRRRVAIKVMRGEANHSPELCARFEREAQIASQIPSDHITEVLDLGELESGQRFIVMEYLVGESLSERLDRHGRLAPRDLLVLVRQVLSALGAAHRAGVIHRDVKPDNVFILGEKAGRRDFVKLLDFGISKLRPVGGELPLTQSGMFVGTPSYMAPEQVGGGEASPLWDLYSVGVILYRGLTGETPFKSQRVDELVYKVALGSFVRPIERVPGLDQALDALVCRAMSRFPEERFQSAEQFIGAIDAWLHARGQAEPAPRPPAVPLHTPSGVVTTARLATPSAGPPPPAASAIPTTRITTELGISGKRRVSSWVTWAAAGAVVFVGAAAIAYWRSDLGSGAAAPDVELLAAQPAPAAAPVAASKLPAPEPTPDPITAPAAATAAAPAAATAPAPAAATAAAAAAKKTDTPASRRKPRTRNSPDPTPAKAEPAKLPARDPEPKTDSTGKARPDWGY